MRRYQSVVFFVFMFVFMDTCFSQITTSTMSIANYVKKVLLGPGVIASNITYTGLPKQIASYTSTPIGGIGIKRGLYLTTGSNGTVSGEVGPDGPPSEDQSVSLGQPGDFYLTALSAGVGGTHDASVLEFDFIPQSDTIKFKYIFASEEYNDFVNSINDVFAFVLNGVTTSLPSVNLAVLPGSSIPITINTVNNGFSLGAATGPCKNCAYYRDNVGGSIKTVYDGLTTILTAKHPVVCGEKYHIKIAIADASDEILDSGVFLEAGSFSSAPPVDLSFSNSNASFTDTVMVEDCNTNCAYFVRNTNFSQKDSFKLDITGSAGLGSDYIQQGNPSFTWPTKIFFDVNQDTFKICNLKALNDGVSEPPETILFTLTTYTTSLSACAKSTSIIFKLYVQDYKTIQIGQNDTIICNGQSFTLDANARFGLPPYTYTWTSPTINTPTFNSGTITSPVTYTINVNDICNKPVSKEVIAKPSTLPVLGSLGPYKFCLDSILLVNASVTGGKPKISYDIQIPGTGFPPYSISNNLFYFRQTETPSSGTYILTITDLCGKSDSVEFGITTYECSLIVPNVVTVNGDGVNDYFRIRNLENFPNSILNVYNRWGTKIYNSNDYKNDWKPQYNSGTYFYALELIDGRKLNGFFQLFKD